MIIPVTITSDKALPILANPPDLELVVTDRLGAFVISAAIPRTSPLYNGMLSDIVNIPNPHDDLFELDQVYTVRFAEGTTAALPLVGSARRSRLNTRLRTTLTRCLTLHWITAVARLPLPRVA